MLQHNYRFQEMQDLFEKLQTYNKDKNSGITRLAYGEEDESAHRFLIEMMEDSGLTVRQDAVGNVFARLAGKEPHLPAVGTGSHIDTVPQGGAYDGALGVIAGFYALMQFRPKQLKRDLELVIFRAEESSRFGFSCAGSKVLSGSADIKKWQQNLDDSGLNILQAIDEAGYSSEDIPESELPEDYFSAFVELHIEQGRCLENEKKQIGIVNGIAAPTRFAVEVLGHADHSGATPMGQRQDALVASAMIISDIHHAACKESAWGTVGTVGKIEAYPNSMNVIPGKVNFFVDIRGIDSESIERVVAGLKSAIEKAEKDNQVNIKIREIAAEQPVKLNDNICQIISNQCEKLNINYKVMLSGAGHDSMYMAKKYPTAMIFIPSKEGISHHPDEYSHFNDIKVATHLLKETLEELANR